MENAYKVFCLITILSYCCFSIPTNTEMNTVSAVIGEEVILFCKNESLGSLTQLIWSKNKTRLVTFAPPNFIHWHPEAHHLQINMTLSKSKDQLYALIIKKALWDHAGNYVCETTTESGVWAENWKLNITDEEEAVQVLKEISILVSIIAVICVGMIAVVPLTIFLYKRRRHNNTQRGAPEMVNIVEKQQDIYENCLESQVSQSHHIYSN